ncbi:MAG: phage tail protein [Flavipsychrobacter sp.]|nr:phage tail protein [Flavipsychrobacter sp.]
MEGTMAYITPWAANFAPKWWMSCEGQIINIASNTALFSLLGTTYGGNGSTTFALPDLRGRVAIGAGSGPGLPVYDLGEMSGTETNTISMSQMAAHTHALNIVSQVPVNGNAFDTDSPEAAYPAISQGGVNIYNDSSNGTFAGNLNVNATIGISGSGFPVNNIQPYLSLYYIICVQGVFPSRN